MHLILFDDHTWDNLLPLTFTRPVSNLRVGILTIAEKWEKLLGINSSVLTREYLSGKFPCNSGEDNLMINGSLLPDKDLVKAILQLNNGESLESDGILLGVRTGRQKVKHFKTVEWLGKGKVYKGDISIVDFPW